MRNFLKQSIAISTLLAVIPISVFFNLGSGARCFAENVSAKGVQGNSVTATEEENEKFVAAQQALMGRYNSSTPVNAVTVNTVLKNTAGDNQAEGTGNRQVNTLQKNIAEEKVKVNSAGEVQTVTKTEAVIATSQNREEKKLKPAGNSSVAKPKKIKLPKGYTLEYIKTLREQNNGLLAAEEKMIYTTDPSVMFTFTGMANKKSVETVLSAFDQIQGKGTFFVTERELRRNADVIKEIVARGQEIGICIYPRPEEGFEDICAEILRIKYQLKQNFGIETNLMKQFSGVVRDDTKEAVSSFGCRLIGTSINAVQNRHKEYRTAEQILPEILGPAIFSLGRGWIVNIRLDFYDKPELAAELMLYLKRKKIDNIAYNSFDDVAGITEGNNSAYQIKSVGEVLAAKDKLWTYPVPENAYVPGIKRKPVIPPDATHEQLVDELSKRYFGEESISARNRTLGFSDGDFSKLDMTGTVKTDDNVIFLTFDDWAHDSSVNPILYVLRKHKVPATFFILTNNIANNPNLLRFIAEEGHDIASHTNMHVPMVVKDKDGKMWPMMGYEEYYNDLNTSYKRLASVIGDMQRGNGRPVLTKFMRPPTLAISSMGTRAIFENGFEFIINGSTSTDDFAAKSLESEIKTIRDGLYYRDRVRKGAIFVMHMTAAAKYTAHAVDLILTANEKKADNDPTKFKVGLLSDYLNENYSQAKSPKEMSRTKRKISWW